MDAGRVVDKVADKLADKLETWSKPARQRQAAAIFLGHKVRTRDRALASAYFAAAAGQWGRWADEPAHAQAVEAGLGSCRPPAHVVDVGTGTGAAANVVARRFPDATVVGTDPSRRMIDHARRMHESRNLSFRRGIASALPVPDGGTDLVTCLNAVPDPAELTRALGPRGQALMATSTTQLADRTDEWANRWRATGFVRVAAGDAGPGSWEVFERQGVPGASPGHGASS